MDIVLVTYNSEKWIDGCLEAIARSSYNPASCQIQVVDNHSSDGTLKKLEEAKKRYAGVFGSLSVAPQESNLGFGRANNLGFGMGSDEIVLFLNIDTALHPDALAELAKAVGDSPEKTAAWELRQFPYEHPKLYDPLTLETDWCSGACLAVRRDAFAEVGGFDERIFMYAEDVDLSWRLRAAGYTLHYVPKAVVNHYTYRGEGEVKPVQYTNSIINNLLLRFRYGNLRDIAEGEVRVLLQFLLPSAFPGAKKALFTAWRKSFGSASAFRKSFSGRGAFQPFFRGFDYSLRREGGFYENRLPEKKPLVSVLIRTCGRPQVLREALLSLRNQTYPHFEAVVVEDGPDTSSRMIREEFPDLDVCYFALGEHRGRSVAGNAAMRMAKGEYFNFLDDDDVLYADHLEVLVRNVTEGSEQAAYSFGFATPIEILERDPYRYRLRGYKELYKEEFDRPGLCYRNYIPINCILFARSLFEEYGGLDEELETLEDWDLWVRYACHTDFRCVRKTTAQYRIPYAKGRSHERRQELDDSIRRVTEKMKTYRMPIEASEVGRMYRIAIAIPTWENIRRRIGWLRTFGLH